MVKKFYIISCAALVACLCLFSQDAGAYGRQSEATARALDAGAGATIRLAGAARFTDLDNTPINKKAKRDDNEKATKKEKKWKNKAKRDDKKFNKKENRNEKNWKKDVKRDEKKWKKKGPTFPPSTAPVFTNDAKIAEDLGLGKKGTTPSKTGTNE